MLPRVLIIEDEQSMRMVLESCLQRQGYRVLSAADGETGLKKALEEEPALILLDIMMPKLDGFALCAELRRLARRVPILMLTARGRVEDRVRGLDCGADDFLCKPFSRDELLARVRALLRRVERHTPELRSVVLGNVVLDFATQAASKNGVPIHLTAKEFSMLKLLLETPGEPVSRERFLDLVWGYASFPTTRTVDKHVASLRAKLEDDPDHPEWIQTVHAVGYRIRPLGKNQ